MATLNKDQIEQKLNELEGWSYEDSALRKSFEFEDFREAFSKMTAIAFIAEAQQHHPDWKNSYNTLEISLASHDQGGITDKDFAMAKAIEAVL